MVLKPVISLADAWSPPCGLLSCIVWMDHSLERVVWMDHSPERVVWMDHSLDHSLETWGLITWCCSCFFHCSYYLLDHSSSGTQNDAGWFCLYRADRVDVGATQQMTTMGSCLCWCHTTNDCDGMVLTWVPHYQ